MKVMALTAKLMTTLLTVVFLFSPGSAKTILEPSKGSLSPTTQTRIPLSQPLTQSSDCPAYAPTFSQDKITAKIPEDAYDPPQCQNLKPPADLKTSLTLQNLNNTFAWQSFLAINWPVELSCDDKSCTATTQPDLSDQGLPQWATWKEAYEVFKEDGSEPTDWNTPRTLPLNSALPPLPSDPETQDKSRRILFEVNQANSNQPLWDQNGNKVYYEVLLNQDEFEVIKNNTLFNLDGQIAYYKKNVLSRQEVVDFPLGDTDDVEGAIELKLAWKIIEADDIPARYFTMEAYVLNDAKQWETKTVGLVGMHIAHKTLSSAQWIWSTFAHVDNLRVDNGEVMEYLAKNQLLKPAFTNPISETLPINVLPEPDAVGVRRTQVLQVIATPKTVETLNQQVQHLLAQQGSVWQYYELINVQYSTDPSSRPTSPGHDLPESLINRSGGKPTPAYLTNPVIETYDQEGNQEASDVVQGPLNNAKQEVFGTQSCMGCHFSAGIATREVINRDGTKQAVFEPGTADFSWLLQTRAYWVQNKN